MPNFRHHVYWQITNFENAGLYQWQVPAAAAAGPGLQARCEERPGPALGWAQPPPAGSSAGRSSASQENA